MFCDQRGPPELVRGPSISYLNCKNCRDFYPTILLGTCALLQTRPLINTPSLGDRIVVVVQKQRNFGPESGPGGSVSISAANKVRRGDIRHAVVVRTAKKYQRPDGSVVKFDDNACVLINKAGEPIGSRLNGIVASELRDRKWSKILSLAPMHL